MSEAHERRPPLLDQELPHARDLAGEYAAKHLVAIAERTGFGLGRFDETAARQVVEMISKNGFIDRLQSGGKERKHMEMTELLRSTQTNITEMRDRLDGLQSELTSAADIARDTYLDLLDKAVDIDDPQVATELDQLAKSAMAIKKLQKSLAGIARSFAKGNREIEDCSTEWPT